MQLIAHGVYWGTSFGPKESRLARAGVCWELRVGKFRLFKDAGTSIAQLLRRDLDLGELHLVVCLGEWEAHRVLGLPFLPWSQIRGLTFATRDSHQQLEQDLDGLFGEIFCPAPHPLSYRGVEIGEVEGVSFHLRGLSWEKKGKKVVFWDRPPRLIEDIFEADITVLSLSLWEGLSCAKELFSRLSSSLALFSQAKVKKVLLTDYHPELEVEVFESMLEGLDLEVGLAREGESWRLDVS